MDKKVTNRLDQSEVVFFKRELEFVKSQTYDTVYKDLKAFNLFPVSTEAPNGATEITWRSFSQFGLAKIIADYAHDFPRVDLYGEEHTVKIYDIGDSYGYSIPEIRRAALAGFALETRRAAVARRAVDELMNTLAFFGDATYNIQGFIDYPGITEYVVPVGAGGSTTWALKTPDEILTDLHGLINAIVEGTTGKEVPDTIIMPLAQYNILKNTRLDDTLDKTIWTFFKENHPEITIEWAEELNGAGDSDGDRFMAYTKDAMHVTFEIPLAFEQLEEEKTGMEYRIPCHGSCAGIIVPYVMAVSYGDGI